MRSRCCETRNGGRRYEDVSGCRCARRERVRLYMAVRAGMRRGWDQAVSRGNQGHRSGASGYTEAQLHRAIAGFLRNRLMPPDFFSTFPAGGGGLMRGRILKATGLKAGMPDIFPLIINGIVYGAEIKAPKGSLSDNQIETHAELMATGAIRSIVIWRSMEDVRSSLSDFGTTSDVGCCLESIS
jgi:hypothetical protein